MTGSTCSRRGVGGKATGPVILPVARGKDELDVEGGLRGGAFCDELEEDGVAGGFVPHGDREVEGVGKVEGGAEILTEYCERDGILLREGILLELAGINSHFGAQHDVCGVGEIVYEACDAHGGWGGREGDLVEANVEVGEEIEQEARASLKHAGCGTLVEGGEAKTAGDYSDSESFEYRSSGFELEEDMVGISGGSYAEGLDRLRGTEEGLEGSSEKLGGGGIAGKCG